MVVDNVAPNVPYSQNKYTLYTPLNSDSTWKYCRPSQKQSSIPTIHVQVLCWFWRGYITSLVMLTHQTTTFPSNRHWRTEWAEKDINFTVAFTFTCLRWLDHIGVSTRGILEDELLWVSFRPPNPSKAISLPCNGFTSSMNTNNLMI